MTLYVFGAFDRFNYGDILFSRIIEDYLQRYYPDVRRVYCSATSADMTSIGGVITKNLAFVTDATLTDGDIILVAGGDVLTVDWITILGHSSSLPLSKMLRAIRRILGAGLANAVVPRLFGIRSQFPFVVSPTDFKSRPRVFYNAVGGSGFLDSPNHPLFQSVLKKLELASHLSVRDEPTRFYLVQKRVTAGLMPDSASCMSVLYDKKFLAPYLPSNIEFGEKYVVMQCAQHHGHLEIERLVNIAVGIFSEHGTKVVLLPIGTAPGHEDNVILENLRERLTERGVDCVLVAELSVFSIMSTLCFSSAYLGTSLHGAITALSYSVPAAPLFPEKVTKLSMYLSTWAEQFHCAFESDGVTFYRERQPALNVPLGNSTAQIALDELGRILDMGLDEKS
jgi:polysaccharide pyruvyl transferase WcaK-like protein